MKKSTSVLFLLLAFCLFNSKTSLGQCSLIISGQGNDSCYGECNGWVSFQPHNATPPYTFSWSPSGGTTDTAKGLCAGYYTLTMVDNSGCSTSAVAQITQPALLFDSIISRTNISCFGGHDGIAQVAAGGGTYPYYGLWTNASNSNYDTAMGLYANVKYYVTVTDANGCKALDSVTLTQPPLLTGTVIPTDVLCNGGTGSANTTPGGGTPPYYYTWSNSATTANVTGLSAGTYSVTISDNNGCSLIASTTITEPPLLTISSGSVVNEKCNGETIGSVSATSGGGTVPYTFAWTPSGGSNATASSLAAGTYTVTLTDAHGCTATASSTITQPAPITIVIDSFLSPTWCHSHLWATVNGGVPPYTYQWLPYNETTDTIKNVCLGRLWYSLTVTDSNGCQVGITGKTPAAVDELRQNNDVKIYPVPAKGVLNIEIDKGGFDATLLQVFDITGRVVMTQTLEHNSTLYTLDVSKLDSGVYFLKMAGKTGQVNKRFEIIR